VNCAKTDGLILAIYTSFDRFSHSWQTVPIHFTMDWPFSPQNYPICMGDLDPHGPSTHGFLGSPDVHTSNGILIGTAISAGLRIMTDRLTDQLTHRQTDHATPSITAGHIYAVLRCSLMIIIKNSCLLTNVTNLDGQLGEFGLQNRLLLATSCCSRLLGFNFSLSYTSAVRQSNITSSQTSNQYRF